MKSYSINGYPDELNLVTDYSKKIWRLHFGFIYPAHDNWPYALTQSNQSNTDEARGLVQIM